MLTLTPEAITDLIFGINSPDTDEEFRAMGSYAGSRYKAVDLQLGEYLKANVSESLMHVELKATYAIIWDAADWQLASLGHDRRKAAREVSRALVNQKIEEADMLNAWVDNLMGDAAFKARGRAFWAQKLEGLRLSQGISNVRKMLEDFGMLLANDAEHFTVCKTS